MAQIMKVRPTKIELVRLKRRLKLSSRVQKIVKDRLSILTMEFLQAARDTVKAKQHAIDAMNQAYKAMTIASGYHGYVALQKELVACEADITVAAGPRSVAGVRLPSLELNEPTGGLRGYNLTQTSSLVDSASDTSREALRAIIELAELQRGLEEHVYALCERSQSNDDSNAYNNAQHCQRCPRLLPLYVLVRKLNHMHQPFALLSSSPQRLHWIDFRCLPCRVKAAYNAEQQGKANGAESQCWRDYRHQQAASEARDHERANPSKEQTDEPSYQAEHG